MRTIHSRRNSPLRARRSRYAYWPECMTCSLALRTLRLRVPRYPSAFSRIFRRCFLLWTDRLTLAIVGLPQDFSFDADDAASAAEQAVDALLVAVDDLGRTAERPLAPARLLLEQVRPVLL